MAVFNLELRQYKNGLASVKNMFLLKLPPFSPRLHGMGKSAAISKLACFKQKRIRSYVALALVTGCDFFYLSKNIQCFKFIFKSIVL